MVQYLLNFGSCWDEFEVFSWMLKLKIEDVSLHSCKSCSGLLFFAGVRIPFSDSIRNWSTCKYWTLLSLYKLKPIKTIPGETYRADIQFSGGHQSLPCPCALSVLRSGLSCDKHEKKKLHCSPCQLRTAEWNHWLKGRDQRSNLLWDMCRGIWLNHGFFGPIQRHVLVLLFKKIVDHQHQPTGIHQTALPLRQTPLWDYRGYVKKKLSHCAPSPGCCKLSRGHGKHHLWC